MKVVVISSLFCAIIPSFILCVIYKGSIYLAWTFFSLYIAVIAIAFILRYRGGKWKTMRVIEMQVSELSPAPGALSESEVMR
jgi:MATE family multidrug resistance protein